MKDIEDMTKGDLFRYGLWALAIIFVLGVAGAWLGVFSSALTAPARVANKTLQTDNIIQSYEWFYDVNAAFEARANQIQQFRALLASEESTDEKRRLRIDMTAMQQTCRDLVTKYNANSEKMNKSIFKGWSLPEALNIQTCEVN